MQLRACHSAWVTPSGLCRRCSGRTVEVRSKVRRSTLFGEIGTSKYSPVSRSGAKHDIAALDGHSGGLLGAGAGGAVQPELLLVQLHEVEESAPPPPSSAQSTTAIKVGVIDFAFIRSRRTLCEAKRTLAASPLARVQSKELKTRVSSSITTFSVPTKYLRDSPSHLKFGRI